MKWKMCVVVVVGVRACMCVCMDHGGYGSISGSGW